MKCKHFERREKFPEQDFNLTRLVAMQGILSKLQFTDYYGKYFAPTPELLDEVAKTAHDAAYALYKLDKDTT